MPPILGALKKLAFSLTVIVLFALYAWQERSRTQGGTSTVIAGNAAPIAPRSAISQTAHREYADGAFTGDPADALWGDLEVQAVISNHQISGIQVLQYPNHRSTSRSINARALPTLIQEAITAQDAIVDIVTGATDTSEAFIRSLRSALKQATA